jgi:hypothetical protein
MILLDAIGDHGLGHFVPKPGSYAPGQTICDVSDVVTFRRRPT